MKTYRLALLTAFVTYVLLIVGGTVNPTGSSLACPDWPTCFGTFTPEMTGGVEYEHTHRLVATFVGLLTCLLGLSIWRSRRDSTLRWLGLGAIGLVVLQGILGGLTVLLKLPPAISLGHLALSMFFFGYMIYLAFRLRPVEGWAPREASSHRVRRIWPAVAVVAVYIQILLGGLVRHTDSALACGTDVPWCLGTVWPNHWQAQIHMSHRFFAFVVLGVVLVASANAAWHALKAERRLAFHAAVLAPWLVAIQIVLGLITVTSTIGVIEVVAHMAVGALLLGVWIVAYFALDPPCKTRLVSTSADDCGVDVLQEVA